MDDQQIRITIGDQSVPLGGRHAEVLPGWTGLRIVRYRALEEATARRWMVHHPMVSLVCAGQVDSYLRIGADEMQSQLTAGEMMFYSGSKEVDFAHWKTSNAVLISVELDPDRLRPCSPDDTHRLWKHLQGEARFTDPELAALIHLLWREGQAGFPHGQLHADSLCLGLTAHVLHRFQRTEAGVTLTPGQLRCINDYIERHLDQNIGLDDLAQAVGLSRFHFSRVFSNTVGCSPYQHVIRKRLEHARHLLLSSELPVAVVALTSGFSSQAHLSALCRRELGTTPRRLREGLA